MAEPANAGPPGAFSALTAALGAEPAPLGSVGIAVARAGVGKTAFLVQLALEALLRGRKVVHVALQDSVDHIRAHYDEILRAVEGSGERGRGNVVDASVRVERGRMIHSFAGRPFDSTQLDRNLVMLAEAAQFTTELVLVDGFESPNQLSRYLPELRRLSSERKVEVWVSIRTDEDQVPAAAGDRVARLTPSGRIVKMTVTRVGAPSTGDEVALALDPVTLLVLTEDALSTRAEADAAPSERVDARDVTLYSGGAAGAEAAFGEVAEKWGAREVSFTFDGHLQARSRGRYELSPTELAMGDVSLAYVSRRLNRTYNDQGGLIRGVLQTLWHMVSRSQQVFVVGRIQDDGTVVGGTGWSVELARMWSRDLWVYDQEKVGWYRWDGATWTVGTPRITTAHLCGTGTRYLEESGRRAIEELFTRSFSNHT